MELSFLVKEYPALEILLVSPESRYLCLINKAEKPHFFGFFL